MSNQCVTARYKHPSAKIYGISHRFENEQPLPLLLSVSRHCFWESDKNKSVKWMKKRPISFGPWSKQWSEMEREKERKRAKVPNNFNDHYICVCVLFSLFHGSIHSNLLPSPTMMANKWKQCSFHIRVLWIFVLFSFLGAKKTWRNI